MKGDVQEIHLIESIFLRKKKTDWQLISKEILEVLEGISLI